MSEQENGNIGLAVILAGGLGTRLRSVVSDRPKPMAEIGGRPFLDYLVERLLASNIQTVLLCVSYMKEKIIDYFSDRYAERIKFAIEDEPLGTAGAIRNAQTMLSDRFLLLNGDTFAPVKYHDMMQFHRSNHADLTMALVRGTSSKFGKILLDGINIIGFVEKGEQDTGFVNAGVYIVEKRLVDKIPKGKPCSFEREFVPSLLGKTALIGYELADRFIDIGEPETYALLKKDPSILEQ